MAARKNKVTLSETWKDRISATMILNRLVSHVEGNLELSPTQIKAADIILKKVVPDLARTEHVGDGGGPVELRIALIEKFAARRAKKDE
jgi:hypothetical protein